MYPRHSPIFKMGSLKIHVMQAHPGTDRWGSRRIRASRQLCSLSCFLAVPWTFEICVLEFIKVVFHLVCIQAGGAQGGGQDLEQALQAKLLAKQRQVRHFLIGQSDGGCQSSADSCRCGSDYVPSS